MSGIDIEIDLLIATKQLQTQFKSQIIKTHTVVTIRSKVAYKAVFNIPYPC